MALSILIVVSLIVSTMTTTQSSCVDRFISCLSSINNSTGKYQSCNMCICKNFDELFSVNSTNTNNDNNIFANNCENYDEYYDCSIKKTISNNFNVISCKTTLKVSWVIGFFAIIGAILFFCIMGCFCFYSHNTFDKEYARDSQKNGNSNNNNCYNSSQNGSSNHNDSDYFVEEGFIDNDIRMNTIRNTQRNNKRGLSSHSVRSSRSHRSNRSHKSDRSNHSRSSRNSDRSDQNSIRSNMNSVNTNSIRSSVNSHSITSHSVNSRSGNSCSGNNNTMNKQYCYEYKDNDIAYETNPYYDKDHISGLYDEEGVNFNDVKALKGGSIAANFDISSLYMNSESIDKKNSVGNNVDNSVSNSVSNSVRNNESVTEKISVADRYFTPIDSPGSISRHDTLNSNSSSYYSTNGSFYRPVSGNSAISDLENSINSTNKSRSNRSAIYNNYSMSNRDVLRLSSNRSYKNMSRDSYDDNDNSNKDNNDNCTTPMSNGIGSKYSFDSMMNNLSYEIIPEAKSPSPKNVTAINGNSPASYDNNSHSNSRNNSSYNLNDLNNTSFQSIVTTSRSINEKVAEDLPTTDTNPCLSVGKSNSTGSLNNNSVGNSICVNKPEESDGNASNSVANSVKSIFKSNSTNTATSSAINSSRSVTTLNHNTFSRSITSRSMSPTPTKIDIPFVKPPLKSYSNDSVSHYHEYFNNYKKKASAKMTGYSEKSFLNSSIVSNSDGNSNGNHDANNSISVVSNSKKNNNNNNSQGTNTTLSTSDSIGYMNEKNNDHNNDCNTIAIPATQNSVNGDSAIIVTKSNNRSGDTTDESIGCPSMKNDSTTNSNDNLVCYNNSYLV